MKKILALILCLVLALGLFAFVACDNPDNPDMPNTPGKPSDYKTVDLTNPTVKKEFIDSFASKVDIDKLVGDINSSNWSFGIKSEESNSMNLDAKFTLVQGGVTSSFDVKADFTNSQQQTLKLMADAENSLMPFSIQSAGTAKAKGSISIPDYLYNNVFDLDAETTQFIKSLIGNFDWTVKSYIDNNYAYIEYPQQIADLVKEYTGEQLPSNKFKLPLGNMLPLGSFYAVDSGDIQAEAKLYLEQLVDYLVNYKVSVAVSDKDGYAIKVSATKDSVLAFLQSDEIGIPQEVLSLINDIVMINTSDLDIYLAVDKDGAFKQVSISLNLDLAFNVAADESNGIPAIQGSLKFSFGTSIERFNGKVTLPNLSDFVEIQ